MIYIIITIWHPIKCRWFRHKNHDVNGDQACAFSIEVFDRHSTNLLLLYSRSIFQQIWNKPSIRHTDLKLHVYSLCFKVTKVYRRCLTVILRFVMRGTFNIVYNFTNGNILKYLWFSRLLHLRYKNIYFFRIQWCNIQWHPLFY